MPRFNADSVTDPQIDLLWETVGNLDSLHVQKERSHVCKECRRIFPCKTRLAIEIMQSAFERQTSKEETG